MSRPPGLATDLSEDVLQFVIMPTVGQRMAALSLLVINQTEFLLVAGALYSDGTDLLDLIRTQ